uniref:C2H2-type domain-containing protein n=3 Tax=Meloidogyne enterolobii TaxID=390850 RepID=A0A6V7VTC1_MELEN|nr:unnamed protein product [Meloidogyne enterolobii]
MALIYPKDLCQLLLECDKCTFSMIDFTQPVYEDETMYRYVNVSKEKGFEEDEQNDRKKAVKMYCNRCGDFVMEFISEVDVTKDILDGIHVLMYHPFTAWNLSKTRFSKKYPFMDLKSRFNNFICSQCSSVYISLDELFEHSLTHLDQ